MTRYKCSDCLLIISDTDLEEDGACPVCKSSTFLTEMCEADGVCTCAEPVSYEMNVCDVCGERVCPCKSHNVELYSRITGYISAVGSDKGGGWNVAKKQEFKDRRRYEIS